jgi:hypothetical protein
VRRAGLVAAAWLAAGPAAAAPLVEQLTAPARVPADRFGWGVAIDGDEAVVAAPGRTIGAGQFAGMVTVLRRIDGAWTTIQTIEEADLAIYGRQLGHRTALHGPLMAIGAPGYGTWGGVHLYHYVSGLWASDSLVVDAVPIAGERLGQSLALTDTTLLIGVTGETLPAMDDAVGRVRVLEYLGGWVETALLLPGDGEGGNRFGWSVAIDGDTAVVGAPGKDTNTGVAYVFTRAGGTWTQTGKLAAASERMSGDYFGHAVAIAGGTIVVGASGRYAAAGAAYVFERDGAQWSQIQELLAEPADQGEAFGAAVGLDGDYAVISGPGFEAQAFGARGGAYLFGRLTAGYGLLTPLRASDGVAGDMLGFALGLSGSTALVGAPYDDANALPAFDPASALGSAYLFRPSQAVGESCVAAADCAIGAVCCDEACVIGTECAEDPTTTTGEPGTSSGGPTAADTGTAGESSSSSGSPPVPEIDPLSEGCGCRSGGAEGSGGPRSGGPRSGGASWLVWVLVVPVLPRRRR